VLVSTSYAVHAGTHRSAARKAPTSAGPVTSATADIGAGGETARLIRAYEAVAHGHRDEGVDVMLGSLYLQRGRFTGDLGTYRQALAAATDAARLAPRDPATVTLLASARFTLHDWAGARSAALRALDLDPRQQNAALVLGDSDLETGRYADAASIYRRLADRVAGSASLVVRLARLAWVTGDLPRAERLAAQALRLAPDNGASGAGLAFYSVFVSQVAIAAGDYVTAVAAGERAVKVAPSWHVAIAASAKALAASGDIDRAISAYRRAAAIVPLPEYLAALGDLLSISGRAAAAAEQYATVGAIARIASSQRDVYNRQLVLFAADHGHGAADAIRMARAELVTRKDAAGYDALAWALHAVGRDRAAQLSSDHALTVDAADPRFEWHAAAIAASLGQRARALALLTDLLHRSPHFDPLQSRRAAALLASLRGNR
jgi:tetratricopeptide (TPR) repeat protein